MKEHTSEYPHSHHGDNPWQNDRKPCRKCCRGKDGAYGLAPQPGMPCECPKSEPEIPCKPKPNNPDPHQTQIPTESRILKTTNPITESEIKDMKKWFNRVDRAGNKYNPSIL